MMSIIFDRDIDDKHRVRVTITTRILHRQWNYYAYLSTDCEASRELLLENLTQNLGDTMANIRETEYNNGWKDKASRRTPKHTWFSRLLRGAG